MIIEHTKIQHTKPRTRIKIGVDPDTKATGIGILIDGKPALTGTAEAKGRTAKERVPQMAEELLYIFSQVANWLNEKFTNAKIDLAIEWQKPRPHDPRPQSILDLAVVSGMAYVAAINTLTDVGMLSIAKVYPSEWKGTIKKAAHQRRLRQKLYGSPTDSSLESVWGKGKASHVLDALGIALALDEGRI